MWFHSLSQLLPSNGVCKSNNKVWTATSLWLLRGGCWHCGCAVCNVHVAMANPKIVGARALLFELIHHLLPRCGNDSRKLWPKSVDIIPRWRDIIMAHSRLVHKLAPPCSSLCVFDWQLRRSTTASHTFLVPVSKHWLDAIKINSKQEYCFSFDAKMWKRGNFETYRMCIEIFWQFHIYVLTLVTSDKWCTSTSCPLLELQLRCFVLSAASACCCVLILNLGETWLMHSALISPFKGSAHCVVLINVFSIYTATLTFGAESERALKAQKDRTHWYFNFLSGRPNIFSVSLIQYQQLRDVKFESNNYYRLIWRFISASAVFNLTK